MKGRALVLAFATVALAGAPEARAGEIAIGVTTGTQPDLVIFDTDAPGPLIASHPVSGLPHNEQIIGLDMRPATGKVFALTSSNRVLALDPQTGESSQLAGSVLATPGFTLNSPGGVDFNPIVDRLRMVNVADDNLRFNPNTFLPVDSDADPSNGNTPDTDLAFDPGDANAGQDPNVVAEANSRNDASTGATVTTLFGIDSSLDILVRQGGADGTTPSPNLGLLFTLGSLGVNVTDAAAFDIVPGAAGSPSDGVAYLAAVPLGGAASTLYDVDIVAPAGPLTSLGTIAGDPLAGLTIALGGGLGFEATSTVASESATEAVVTVQRSGETLSAAQFGGTVRLPFRTVDRTAVAGKDYTPVSGTLEFAEDETSKQVTVPLLGDGDDESAESFGIELGPVGDGAVLLEPEHTVEIADDDSPALQFLTAAKAPGSLRALGKSKKLKLEFSCSNACAADFALRLGKKKIGEGSESLQQAGVATAQAKLSKAGRKKVAKKVDGGGRTAKLVLEGTATDPAGGVATRTLKLRIPIG